MHTTKTLFVLGMTVAGVFAAACDPETATPVLQSRSLRFAERGDQHDEAAVAQRWETITSIDLNADENVASTTPADANDVLVARAQRTCKNCAKIKKAKAKFNGLCDPATSKGFKSSHNCPGKSYLCVEDGVATYAYTSLPYLFWFLKLTTFCTVAMAREL
jgi:hypothetical protein